MTKYSFELKLKVIQDYENGLGDCDYLANKYQVKNEAIVRRWVKAYKELGAVGIQRKRQNTVYSTQFKLNAVNLYLTSEKSYREIAHELGMNNPPLLTRWVSDYRKKGEFAFSKVRGRPRKEADLPETSIKKTKDEVTQTKQELAKLQNENLNLRMEVEYLKGLRRLRQEQHKREKPEWSVNSDENSSSPLSNS